MEISIGRLVGIHFTKTTKICDHFHDKIRSAIWSIICYKLNRKYKKPYEDLKVEERI